VLVVALLAAVFLLGDRGPKPLTQGDVDQAVKDQITSALEERDAAPPAATQAYQTILPSLVLVRTKRAGGAPGETGTGAGVVVNANGTILTSLHVVDGASSIQVTFADGTRAAAVVDGAEPDNDTAVLRPASLPEVVVPAVLGGGAEVGDEVYAVGHPLGLTRTLTAGVVSALDRSIEVTPGRTLRDLIQFDAAVNPGNSGGPLLNEQAQVIGIVTALANPADQPFSAGLSFAVPIEAAGGAAQAPPQ
jgi:S1-C subfamily serine protease